MQYYQSSIGGVYKVYACDPTSGKITVILDYQSLGMYNVLNQKLSTTAPSEGLSPYDLYIVPLEPCDKTVFTGVSTLAKSFLDSL